MNSRSRIKAIDAEGKRDTARLLARSVVLSAKIVSSVICCSPMTLTSRIVSVRHDASAGYKFSSACVVASLM